MKIIKTQIDSSSAQFDENRTYMSQLVDDLREKLNITALGGSERSRKKHTDRGKLLVRDRINLLLDAGSPFLEVAPMAAFDMYKGAAPAAGVVAGIGVVHGQQVMIVANDATVKGGTYFPMTVKKHLRAQEIALENQLPCIYLVDSGGAFLPLQDEVFPDKEHFGRIFYNQTQLSARNIPQIAVVMGSCTAGGAYVPAMCDEAIIVKEQGTIFLGGPPLVKAATGEVVDAESLGGAEVHSSQSGVTDHFAENDPHALQMARNCLQFLNRPTYDWLVRKEPQEPLYPSHELYGIIPQSTRIPYDVKEIIARVVDASAFQEFKVLFAESALKGAHFVELCNQRKIPLVFLQNITGFMVGQKYENAGIAKDGAKMVTAVACAQVPKFPKFTVVIGGSFGAGNYAMNGRAYQGRFLWMWPNSRISVMGGDQAASVLTTVKQDGYDRSGESWASKDKENFYEQIRNQYELQGHPYYSTARLWDDGVIDPVDTRQILSLAIETSTCADIENVNYGVFRM